MRDVGRVPDKSSRDGNSSIREEKLPAPGDRDLIPPGKRIHYGGICFGIRAVQLELRFPGSDWRLKNPFEPVPFRRVFRCLIFSVPPAPLLRVRVKGIVCRGIKTMCARAISDARSFIFYFRISEWALFAENIRARGVII